MGRRGLLPLLVFFLFLVLSFSSCRSRQVEKVDVGVVLDMSTLVGKTSMRFLQMGVEDFYAAHPDYRTRVVLHLRDSGNDSVGAASATLDLLKNVHVQAILGPGRSSQASFVTHLGGKTQVPIVSFQVTTPSISPAESPYFICTAVNSLFQVDALASIVKTFGWKSVVPIYEDTEYGTGLLPYLTDAFEDVDAQVPYRSVIPTSATDLQITGELHKLMNMQTRVFIVHMLPPLSSILFSNAKNLGMLSEGYVWIITEALTDLLDTLDIQSIESMQGVLGIKTFVQKSKQLENFKARWRATRGSHNANEENPSIYGLWAYDTAWAMVMAVEKAGVRNLGFKTLNISNDFTDLAKLGISQNGPMLRQAILNTKFRGISGDFHLVDGQLQPFAFQIVNLMIGGKGRVVGFWTKGHGISGQLYSTGSRTFSASHKMDLNPIIWPGGSHNVPKGWEIPTNRRILRVGVPVKGGFIEFVNTTSVISGYCIDVFDMVMHSLPYSVHYEYIPYKFAQHPGSYNVLIDQVVFQNFDAVVGDVTIVSNRSQYVDFTLPYTESGVAMVVPIRNYQDKNGWIFLKPLTTDLWLGILAFFLFTGIVVWVIEHQKNDDFRGPPLQQMGTIFYFAFSTMVFAHRERVMSNLSRFVMIIWVFFVLILTSSYKASLTSLLTVERLQPTVTDVNDLLKNGESVGYQDGSFVLELLKGLNFDESRLKNYSSPEEFAEALSKGSSNGGVAAIFDEIPYIQVFLNNRCSDYAMVGKIYKTDGFGFVFPKGSPLVPDVSRAVLNVTQGEKMQKIENTWFGNQTSCASDSAISDSNRLEFSSFLGLFLITGAVSIVALLIFFGIYFYSNSGELKRVIASENTVWQKVVAFVKHYDMKDPSSCIFKKEHERMPTF